MVFLNFTCQTGDFHFDGFMDIVLQQGLLCHDLLHAGEADLARRLHVLCLRDQDTLLILEQGAFDEQQRTVFLKAMHENDVLSLECITRDAPLQLFRQWALQEDRP